MPLRILIFILIFFTKDIIFAQQITCNNSPIPTFYNQQDVTFNSENGTVKISNFDCDPCKTGLTYNECNNIRICRSNCDKLIPIDAIQQVQDCQDECLNEPDPQVQAYCYTNCDAIVYFDYYNCLEDCGSVGIIRQPVSQISRIRIWYTTALTIPYFQGNPNFDMIFPVKTYNGQNLTLNLDNNFGNVPLSYCIFTETVIKYNDGSCCKFINYFCANKG